MNQYFIHYTTQTQLFLDQGYIVNNVINCAKFSFPEVCIGMKNWFEKDSDSSKHYGLDFICELSATSQENAINVALPYVEFLLSLLSFCHLRYCPPATIFNVTEVKANEETAQSWYYSYPSNPQLPQNADQPINVEVLIGLCDKLTRHPKSDLIISGINWLRIELNENTPQIKFLELWNGLETIKTLLNEKVFQENSDDIWSGVKFIFEKQYPDFQFEIQNAIKEKIIDKGITQPLEFINTIKESNTKIQNILIYSICFLLDCPKIYPKIIENRIYSDIISSFIFKGYFEKFSSDFDFLVANYPRLPTSLFIKSSIPSIDNLKIEKTIESSIRFGITPSNTFKMTAFEVYGNTEAKVQLKRIKQTKQVLLNLDFEVGKKQINKNRNSVIFKPWAKLIDNGEPVGKIFYIFFNNDEKDLSDLNILGSICLSKGNKFGGKLLFFPGFSADFIEYFDSEGQVIEPRKRFVIDHFSLENTLDRWHITSKNLDGSSTRIENRNVINLDNNYIHWLTLDINTTTSLEKLCQNNQIQFDCFFNNIEMTEAEKKNARSNIDDHIIRPSDARVEDGSAFWHFEFLIKKGDAPFNPAILSMPILGINEKIFPVKIPSTSGIPIKYFEFKIPDFPGIFIIRATQISGALPRPAIISHSKEKIETKEFIPHVPNKFLNFISDTYRLFRWRLFKR